MKIPLYSWEVNHLQDGILKGRRQKERNIQGMATAGDQILEESRRDGAVLILRDPRWQVNCVAFKPDDKVILVDTLGSPGKARAARERIERHFGASVSTVINTHHHYDHVLGNQVFADAEIISHTLVPQWMESYRERLQKQIAGKAAFEDFRLTPPQQLVEADTDLPVGATSVWLQIAAPCHTNNDLMVTCEALNIVVTGDIHVPNAVYPINLNSGGDLEHWISILASLESKAKSNLIIPGHFTPAKRAALQQQRMYLETLLSSAEDLGDLPLKDYVTATGQRFREFASMQNFNRYHGRNLATVREYVHRKTKRTEKE
jgi:glyoxylase-like metal-dependent hydrolase (beta-lactamase superfamily II)